ncbi:MAG: SGNH/GDSL hydrolase family protein, partial [Myxococcales bacterium]|nr:SGNH/GDSL hydrolase family protein [Myxococcales bacterium]
VLLGFVLGVAEVAARVAYRLRDQVRAARGWLPPKAPFQLHGYEVLDPEVPGLWRLRPGTNLTLAEAMDMNRELGRSVGLQNLIDAAAVLGITENETIFRVNASGYKGPELDPAHSKTRILAVGDSCTFGTMFDDYTYSRSLERELAQSGLQVEVINAGVGGYSPAHSLARMDEFQALGAEIALVYHGWNALFSERGLFPRWQGRSRLLRAWAAAWRTLMVDPRMLAQRELDRPLRPDANAPEIELADAYTPSFLPDVRRIVSELSDGGTRVVVVTLPALFTSDEEPSAQALEVGHMPPYTDNPFTFAHLAERYNELLRDLARDEGLMLIDLDRWSREALHPRASFFTDSVHLTPLGQEMIGVHMAGELESLLRELQKDRSEGG